MPLDYNSVGPYSTIDYERLVEDLVQTWSTPAGDRYLPPASSLSVIGSAVLFADSRNVPAQRVQLLASYTDALKKLYYSSSFSQKVPLNLVLFACIAAREDLYRDFVRHGQYQIEEAVRWLVLHGINEHRLWHLVDDAFIAGLLSSDGMSSRALDVILLAERPEWQGDGAGVRDGFESWVLDEAYRQYKLDWCLGPVSPPPPTYRPMDGDLSSIRVADVDSIFQASARRQAIYFDTNMISRGFLSGTLGESGGVAGVMAYGESFEILATPWLLSGSRIVIELEFVGPSKGNGDVPISFDDGACEAAVDARTGTMTLSLDAKNLSTDGVSSVLRFSRTTRNPASTDRSAWIILRRLWSL